MNKVILMGRLTRDPEVRYSQGERQMAIARYTLAVDRRGRNAAAGEQTADFLPCIAFDKAAEFAENYFHQGTKLIVTGRIQTGSYTNKDGQYEPKLFAAANAVFKESYDYTRKYRVFQQQMGMGRSRK